MTGSQILFFKDPTWVNAFQKQIEEHGNAKRRGSESSPASRITFPKMSAFKPDEVLSVKDAIAITETSYNKVRPSFCLRVLREAVTDTPDLSLSVPQRVPVCDAARPTVPSPGCRRDGADRVDVTDQLRLRV